MFNFYNTQGVKSKHKSFYSRTFLEDDTVFKPQLIRVIIKMTLPYGLQMFCNILSITIIAGGLFLKIPQIVSVIKAGNTEGLSLNSVILEECA
jgi:hypothetical protein